MTRSRESKLSGIYYPRGVWMLTTTPKPRFYRLYRWWDGISSDPMFWKVLIYGLGIAFLMLAVTL